MKIDVIPGEEERTAYDVREEAGKVTRIHIYGHRQRPGPVLQQGLYPLYSVLTGLCDNGDVIDLIAGQRPPHIDCDRPSHLTFSKIVLTFRV